MKEIKNNVFYCGLNDKERRIFDELVPLPQGTTYNSYFIKGSKYSAIIDTMYPPRTEEYLKLLEKSGIDKVDFIVANHGEQDHSGSLPALIEKFPNAKILTNPKCSELIQEMLCVPEEKIQIVSDGEEISLGDKTLRFIYAPWVHWPDTMFTYIPEYKLMFTCDFLGAHYPFEELYADKTEALIVSAKRYYAEIMMPFRSFCQKYLKLLRGMDIEMILPSHGPIHKDIEFILKLYERWTGDVCQNTVVIPYVSMYGSTEEMVDYLKKKLLEKKINVEIFDVAHEDLGELAMSIVEACTIVFGSSMVLAGPHPAAVTAAYLAGALRPKTKFVSFIGSYGWGGVLEGKLEQFLTPAVKAEKLTSVIVKGKPRKEDFEKLDILVEEIYQKHKSLGLV